MFYQGFGHPGIIPQASHGLFGMQVPAAMGAMQTQLNVDPGYYMHMQPFNNQAVPSTIANPTSMTSATILPQHEQPVATSTADASKAPALTALLEERRDLEHQRNEFEKQFTHWENEYQQWKELNKDHPDRDKFRSYEQQHEQCKVQMLEMRKQFADRLENLSQRESQHKSSVSTQPLSSKSATVTAPAPPLDPLTGYYNSPSTSSYQPTVPTSEPVSLSDKQNNAIGGQYGTNVVGQAQDTDIRFGQQYWMMNQMGAQYDMSGQNYANQFGQVYGMAGGQYGMEIGDPHGAAYGMAGQFNAMRSEEMYGGMMIPNQRMMGPAQQGIMGPVQQGMMGSGQGMMSPEQQGMMAPVQQAMMGSGQQGMMGSGQQGMMGPGQGMMGPGQGMMDPGQGMMGPGQGMMGPGQGMMMPVQGGKHLPHSSTDSDMLSQPVGWPSPVAMNQVPIRPLAKSRAPPPVVLPPPPVDTMAPDEVLEPQAAPPSKKLKAPPLVQNIRYPDPPVVSEPQLGASSLSPAGGLNTMKPEAVHPPLPGHSLNTPIRPPFTAGAGRDPGMGSSHPAMSNQPTSNSAMLDPGAPASMSSASHYRGVGGAPIRPIRPPFPSASASLTSPGVSSGLASSRPVLMPNQHAANSMRPTLAENLLPKPQTSGAPGTLLPNEKSDNHMANNQAVNFPPNDQYQANSFPKSQLPGSFPSRNEPGTFPPRPESGSCPPRPESGSFPPRPEPGSFPPRPEPGSFPPRPEPGSLPSRNEPGSFPPRNEPRGFPPRNEPGSFPQRSEPGGLPPRNEPGGFPQRSEPGRFPVRNDSNNESPGNIFPRNQASSNNTFPICQPSVGALNNRESPCNMLPKTGLSGNLSAKNQSSPISGSNLLAKPEFSPSSGNLLTNNQPTPISGKLMAKYQVSSKLLPESQSENKGPKAAIASSHVPAEQPGVTDITSQPPSTTAAALPDSSGGPLAGAAPSDSEPSDLDMKILKAALQYLEKPPRVLAPPPLIVKPAVPKRAAPPPFAQIAKQLAAVGGSMEAADAEQQIVLPNPDKSEKEFDAIRYKIDLQYREWYDKYGRAFYEEKRRKSQEKLKRETRSRSRSTGRNRRRGRRSLTRGDRRDEWGRDGAWLGDRSGRERISRLGATVFEEERWEDEGSQRRRRRRRRSLDNDRDYSRDYDDYDRLDDRPLSALRRREPSFSERDNVFPLSNIQDRSSILNISDLHHYSPPAVRNTSWDDIDPADRLRWAAENFVVIVKQQLCQADGSQLSGMDRLQWIWKNRI